MTKIIHFGSAIAVENTLELSFIWPYSCKSIWRTSYYLVSILLYKCLYDDHMSYVPVYACYICINPYIKLFNVNL